MTGGVGTSAKRLTKDAFDKLRKKYVTTIRRRFGGNYGEADILSGLRNMGIEEGDIVIYKKYGGTDITVDGTAYVLVDEDSILAVRS